MTDMSMLSAQVDELRSMAESVGLEMPQAATLMMGAADTIWELRCECADLVGERERLFQANVKKNGEILRLTVENAKLRELCETVIDNWMSKVCPTFPFCEFGGEYEICTDDTCGNQLYRQMLRELGVEVEP